MKKLSLSLLLILIINVSAYASYEQALELFQENNFKGSLTVLGEILEVANDMEPDSPNYKIRYLAAHNHWKLGNTASAITHFTRCMDIKKNTVDPHVDLALYFFELKRYGEAEQTVRKGLKIKKAAMLYYIQGEIALKRESYWRAKGLFEKTNSLNTELDISYNGLGMALLKLKKFSQANTAFSVAQAINPKSAEILNNVGLSLELQKKYKEAYKYYEQASSLDEKNETIKRNMKRVEDKE
ncbi:MAG: tetratricopeptide repeat protein [bacterium]|nr:tetratricopeptide repeat protein [bacterium]